MSQTPNAATIEGLGVDVDRKNDPTYPMRKRTDAEHQGYTWDRPPLQQPTVEVLHSIERPDLTAVFGTTVPPSGLSGRLRRYAFRFSESSYGHWLPLMLADRIGMIEGVVDDLGHARVPNVFAGRGWGAEWRYNRPALLRRVGLWAALGTAAWLLLGVRGRRRRTRPTR